MKLFYDIQLKDGEIIHDCYFVKYQKPIRSGNRYILAYVDSHASCFDKMNNEIRNKDFSESTVLSIHDEIGNDLTSLFAKKHQLVCSELGYDIGFPVFRERVMLEC